LHLFRSFFHFRLYSTSQISDIAVPRFLYLPLWRLKNNPPLRRGLAEATDNFAVKSF